MPIKTWAGHYLMISSVDEIINVKKIALRNVLGNSIDFLIEKAYRYFSKTYSTPLFEAYDKLTPHDVLRIYYEDSMLEGYTEENKTVLLDHLASLQKNTNEPYFGPNMMTKAPVDDDQWIAQMEKEIKKKEDETRKAKEAKEALKKLSETFNNISDKLDSMSDGVETMKFNIKE